MQNFVYLVGDPVARECVVVDPAWEIDTIVDTAQADDMRLTGALVTHTHQDHVGGSLASWGMPGRIPGVEELLARVPLKVYVHKAEREFLPGLGSDLVKVDNHDTLAIGRLALMFLLTPHGFDFFTGVPCSLVEDVIAVLETEREAPYVAAVREDAAVGLAAGAWLAGRRPCVLMQNSGLGTSLNALASLSLMYGLPLLVVVTWRGHEGKDAPEHILTGRITPQILDLLGMPYRVLSAESAADDVAWAAKEMDTRMQPVAIVVPPRVLQTGGAHHDAGVRRDAETRRRSGAGDPATAPRGDATLVPRISRLAATTAAETESAVRAALGADGPHFVLVKTTAEEADVPRIPYSPAEIRDRFRASL